MASLLRTFYTFTQSLLQVAQLVWQVLCMPIVDTFALVSEKASVLLDGVPLLGDFIAAYFEALGNLVSFLLNGLTTLFQGQIDFTQMSFFVALLWFTLLGGLILHIAKWIYDWIPLVS